MVVAAGRGVRMGGPQPKQFLELEGKPILAWTLVALIDSPRVRALVVVAPPDQVNETRRILTPHLPANAPITYAAGGAERQDSVYNGLLALGEDFDWVLIHDGVRPFVTAELIERTLAAALGTGAAICALPATDTVKRVRAESVVATLPREEIRLVQTPQVFRRRELLEAHRRSRADGRQATDDAALVERLGIEVRVVAGEPFNRKITTPEDLAWARWMVAERRHAGLESGRLEPESPRPEAESSGLEPRNPRRPTGQCGLTQHHGSKEPEPTVRRP